MDVIFGITLPIFLLIITGFVAVKINLLPRTVTDALGAFILNLSVPALIITSLAKTPLNEVVSPLFIIAYAGGCISVYLLVFIISRYFMSNTSAKSAFLGLGAALPNSIIMGYPLLVQSFEAAPVNAFTMALLIENILILPLTVFLMEATTGDKSVSKIDFIKQLGHRLFNNPIMIAVVSGLTLSILSLPIPQLIDKTLTTLGSATAGASFIFIGATLAKTKMGNHWKEMNLVSIAKLILHPLIVLGIIMLLPDFDPTLQVAAVILACVPMFGLYPIIGSKYGFSESGASTLFYTTICSFITLSTALYLLL